MKTQEEYAREIEGIILRDVDYVGRKCFFRVGQINAQNVEKMVL